jgi:glycerate kinase
MAGSEDPGNTGLVQLRERLDRGAGVAVVGHSVEGALSAPMARKALELGARMGGMKVTSSRSVTTGAVGFLECYSELMRGTIHRSVVPAVEGSLVLAEFLASPDCRVAALEAAQLAANPASTVLRRSTAGLGVLIARALQLGATEIHIGLGGLRCWDGGVGMLVALYRETVGRVPGPALWGGEHLTEVPQIDFAALRAFLSEVKLIGYCDALEGAPNTEALLRQVTADTHKSGRASEEHVARLMLWARRLEQLAGVRLIHPGVFAGGGLGMALLALGGRLVDGLEEFCARMELDREWQGAKAVLTCEAHFDQNSLAGGAPWKIARRAVAGGLRAAILCGTAEPDAVEAAAESAIDVVEFARMLPNERRAAEAFVLMQRAASYYCQTGRTDAPPPMVSSDQIQKLRQLTDR